MEFEIPYWISNNGDGSASVRPCASMAEAEAKDDEQQETGEGWGEHCAGTIKVKILAGKPYIRIYDDTDYKWKWVIIE